MISSDEEAIYLADADPQQEQYEAFLDQLSHFVLQKEIETNHQTILTLAKQFVQEEKAICLPYMTCTCEKCNHSLLYGFYCIRQASFVYPSYKRFGNMSSSKRRRTRKKRRTNPVFLIFEQHHANFFHIRKQLAKQREETNATILSLWKEIDVVYPLVQKDPFWIECILTFLDYIGDLVYVYDACTFLGELPFLVIEWREQYHMDILRENMPEDVAKYICLPYCAWTPKWMKLVNVQNDSFVAVEHSGTLTYLFQRSTLRRVTY